MQCHFSLSPHFPTCEQRSTTISPSKAQWSGRAGPSTGHISDPLCPTWPSISRSCQLHSQSSVRLISPYTSPAPPPHTWVLVSVSELASPPLLHFSPMHPSPKPEPGSNLPLLRTPFPTPLPLLSPHLPRRPHCTQSETQGPPGAPGPYSLAPSHTRFSTHPRASTWHSHPLHSYKLAPSPPSDLPERPSPAALYKILPLNAPCSALSHIIHQPTYYVRVHLLTLDILISLLRVRIQLCPQQHPPGLHQARHWVNARFGLDSNAGI